MKKLAVEKIKGGYLENKFKRIFKKDKFCIIGEIKRASPSEGVISEDANAKAIAKMYENLGFFAISVLTERFFFQGFGTRFDGSKKRGISARVKKRLYH